ncbi:helix-turn-helix transcriptional regulator [Massilia sp. CMS3.1]|uniref:helix-turn-helix transcriptional regulator n=1 Tax=Massilia sp. CMS3.1 TaxID=3373083 RepID=UPI003EE63250
MARLPLFPLELAQLLEKRRRERGVTQEQLAAAANVSRRTINAFIKGDTDIGLRRLTRLCIVLDLVIELHPREMPTEQELPSIFRVEE